MLLKLKHLIVSLNFVKKITIVEHFNFHILLGIASFGCYLKSVFISPVSKSSQTFLKAVHLSKQITKTSIMLVDEGILFHWTNKSSDPKCTSKWLKLQQHSLLAKISTVFFLAWLFWKKEQDFCRTKDFSLLSWALSPPGL